jgi:hypothetical protein
MIRVAYLIAAARPNNANFSLEIAPDTLCPKASFDRDSPGVGQCLQQRCARRICAHRTTMKLHAGQSARAVAIDSRIDSLGETPTKEQ